MGRPTKFKAEHEEQAAKLCREFGATDAQLADFFGVTEQTINNWKKKNPEFFESLKEAKAEADERVQKALYQRALGYEYIETKTITGEKKNEVHTTNKAVIPDVTAQIFWLKNRRPAEWRDKQDVEHTGSVGGFDIVITGTGDPVPE